MGRIARPLLLAVACAVAALGFLRALAIVPSATSEQTAEREAGGSGPRPAAVGLSETFDLDGAQGSPLSLQSDRLLRVRTLDRGGVPSDLYLRAAFFDVADLDGWRMAPFRARRRDTTSEWRFRQQTPGVDVSGLELEQLAPVQGMVFVPPGGVSITGLPDLQVDPRRMWFRQPATGSGIRYGVEYQELTEMVGDRRPDESWARIGLTDVPERLDPRQFTGLLRSWLPAGELSAGEAAAAISTGLQSRCSYALREPQGRFQHALLNFLHGNREGFCMHFASALAIMLRYVGVPCRIGVGLYGGEPDPENFGARVYGSQHAHAWVEIPFRGLGWVVFDATPPANRAAGSLVPGFRQEDFVDPEADEEQGGGIGGLFDGGLFGRIADSLSHIWVWAALVLLWFVLAWRPTPRSVRDTAKIARQAMPARRLLGRILRTLAKAGFPRAHGETLEVYLDGLRTRAAFDEPVLADAFDAYQEVRFGARPFDTDRETRLSRGVDIAAAAVASDD